jgi:DNA gyrase subunit A
MKFRDDDLLVSCDVFSSEGDTQLLVVTSEGFGKRVEPEQFSRKGRAGLGVRAIGINERKGEVIGALFVAPDDEIMLISSGGIVIRTLVGDVSVQGRDATGVTVMSLPDDEHVAAITRLFIVDGELDGELEGALDGDVDEQSADAGPSANGLNGVNGADGGGPTGG